jgi:hypothetical protein
MRIFLFDLGLTHKIIIRIFGNEMLARFMDQLWKMLLLFIYINSEFMLHQEITNTKAKGARFNEIKDANLSEEAEARSKNLTSYIIKILR